MDFLYELEDSGYDIKQLVWNNNFYPDPLGTTSCTRSGWLRRTDSPSGTWAGGARLGNNGSLKNNLKMLTFFSSVLLIARFRINFRLQKNSDKSENENLLDTKAIMPKNWFKIY